MAEEMSYCATWQCCYERNGVAYWWDYPPEVCRTLDDSRESNEQVSWVWDWQDGSGFSRYVLDTVEMTQVNLDTKHARPLRRVLVEKRAHSHTSGSQPTSPGGRP